MPKRLMPPSCLSLALLHRRHQSQFESNAKFEGGRGLGFDSNMFSFFLISTILALVNRHTPTWCTRVRL